MRLHDRQCAGEDAGVVGIAFVVGVLHVPAFNRLKSHPLKVHGFLCKVLDVNLEEDFVAVIKGEKSSWRPWGVYFGLHRERIGHL